MHPAVEALHHGVDGALCVGIGLASAGQHDVTGAQLGQVRRRVQAERAQTTGDQVRPIPLRLQRFRHLHHDLADVPGLLHPAERGLGLRQGVDLGGHRRPLTLGKSVGHLFHEPLDMPRIGHHRDVERDDLVVDVRPNFRHALGSPDVALGDLGEPAALGGRPHRGLDEAFAGQAVQHHVDALAARVGENLVREIGCARIVDVLHAHLAQRGALVGAGSGEDNRALLPRHLHRGQPDTTTGGVDQHAVARLELRPIEREPDRQRSRGQRRRVDRVDALGDHGEQLLRHVEPAGEGALHGAEHPLPDLESGDLRTQFGDDTAQVTADGPGIAGVEAEDVEHIAEVEAGGLDPDLHLVRRGRRHLLLGQPQVVDRTTLGGSQHVIVGPRHRQVAAARPVHQARHEELALPQREFRLGHRRAQYAAQPIGGVVVGAVEIDEPQPQRRLLVDDRAAEAPQRGLHRIDGLAGLGGHGAFGDEPQAAGEVQLLLGECGLHRAEDSADLGLQPRCDVRCAVDIVVSRSAPNDSGDRCAALGGGRDRLLPGGGVERLVKRDSSRQPGCQFVETGDQPRAGGRLGGGLAVLTGRGRCRALLPPQRVQQAGGVATEPAQQRLPRRPLHGELGDTAEALAVPIQEVDVEDLRLVGQLTGVPAGPGVEAPRHLLAQLDLAVPQRQEQVVHAVFGGQQRREGREGHTGAEVKQDRVNGLAAEVLGEFVTDGHIADGHAVPHPQRLERGGPGGAPRQFHVVEGLEELLGTQPLHAFDDVLHRTGDIVRGIRFVGTGQQRAVGVQRPLGLSDPVRPAVHLEFPAVAAVEGADGQLRLARRLVGQNDRLVEKDFLHPRRRSDRGQGHCRVRRTGDHDGAVDDVVRQPRLRLDRQHIAVDRVARGQILGTAQDSGRGRSPARSHARDVGGLGPEAAPLERVGRQFDAVSAVLDREVRPVPADVRRGQRFGDLALCIGALAQRHDGARGFRTFGPALQCGRRQDRLRSDLHEYRATQRRDGLDTLGELHRLTRMPPPVLRVDRRLGVQHRTGAVADQRQRRHRELELRCERLEFVEHRVQQLRVEGVTGLEPGAARGVFAAGGDDLLRIRTRTRQHGVAAVVRTDRHARERLGGALHVFGVGEHRHHAATRGQTGEQPAALGDQAGAVFQAEHTGHAGRRVLTDAVAQHRIRFDPP
ncbi:hypothetical protein MAUB1S_11645 [Mycolicibacterium aubagnense]